MADFKQAFDWLMDGKAVTRADWDGRWIRINDLTGDVVNNNGTTLNSLNIQSILSESWELKDERLYILQSYALAINDKPCYVQICKAKELYPTFVKFSDASICPKEEWEALAYELGFVIEPGCFELVEVEW